MRQQLYLAALINQAPLNVKNAILAKAQISDIAPFEAAINNTRNCIAGKQVCANETTLASAFCSIVKGEKCDYNNHYYKAAALSLEKDFFSRP